MGALAVDSVTFPIGIVGPTYLTKLTCTSSRLELSTCIIIRCVSFRVMAIRDTLSG